MHLETLIHNVGHHDLYLILSNPGEEDRLIKPINVKMNSIGLEVFEFLKQDVTCVQDERCPDTFYFSRPMRCRAGDAQKTSRWVSGSFTSKANNTIHFNENTVIKGIRAPILYPIINEFQRSEGELHFIFLTKEEPKNKGRSTRFIAHILQMLLGLISDRIQGAILTQDSMLDFSFPNEAKFFRNKLQPLLTSLRARVVEYYAAHNNREDWSRHFCIHLSLNTGTMPVVISILNALKDRVSHLYLVEDAKRWPTNDIFGVTLIHKQEFIQIPAVPVTDIVDAAQKKAIEEMVKWRKDFEASKPIREAKDKDGSFFFRKGKQEVLATVVYERDNELHFERGVNLEVSLPTGSLCAERNAIGSILVKYPKLERHEIKAIAVLCLKEEKATLGPCGACKEWLQKIIEVNPSFAVLTFKEHDCENVYVETL